MSKETDVALRTLLATRGGRKGTLSRFVEEALNSEVLRHTLSDTRERNADLDADDVARLINEECGAARAAFWTDARR